MRFRHPSSPFVHILLVFLHGYDAVVFQSIYVQERYDFTTTTEDALDLEIHDFIGGGFRFRTPSLATRVSHIIHYVLFSTT